MSLWLCPTGQEAHILRQAIQALAKQQSGSPEFDPHVTLLGSIPLPHLPADVVRRLQRVLSSAGVLGAALELDILPAQHGQTYHQSVLAPVQRNTSLSALRKACEDEFDIHSSTPYFPHLSLLYGDLSQDRRDELAAHVNGSLQLLPRTAKFGELCIVRTVGPVEDWEVIGRVTLRV